MEHQRENYREKIALQQANTLKDLILPAANLNDNESQAHAIAMKTGS